MTKYIYHYVYRITNKLLSKHYYGCRSSNILPKDDIGVKYFSSSKDKEFRQDQIDNPQNYKYKIIKVFDNKIDAMSLEIKLHAKFDVKSNENFYNRANQKTIGFDTTGLRYKVGPRSEEYKQHLRKPKNEEHKQKIREARKRQVLIQVSRIIDRKVMDLGNFVKWCNGVSDETRKKLSAVLKDNKIYKWCHPKHGVIECTKQELCDRFPEIDYGYLTLAINGTSHHKEWGLVGIEYGNKKEFCEKYLQQWKKRGEENGCELLSTEYLGSSANLKWRRISDGFIFERSPCNINSVGFTIIGFAYDKWKKIGEENGYELLGSKYSGSVQRISWKRLSDGAIFSILSTGLETFNFPK
jgi:hypothetical protein